MRTPRAVVAGALAQAHRHDWASVLAATARTTRDLDLAQESVQEAYAQAMEAWARDGVPHNPAAWLTVTARRRATDVVRRQASLRGKLPLLVVPDGDDPPGPDLLPGDLAPVLHDDRLRLIFMCCHPALDDAARAALTLRLVLGVPTADVAALFLVPTATMAARITRAKRKIARAHIPFAVPRREQLPERLPAVLDVTYLLGTLGHAATSGERRQQGELLDRAVELATLLRRHVPHDPELLGLGALLELLRARAATATDDDGTPVPLSGQDRSRWDRDAIDRAHRTVVGCLRAGASGPYLLQAAIAAVHATAPSHAATDWTELVTLYDALLARQPSPWSRSTGRSPCRWHRDPRPGSHWWTRWPASRRCAAMPTCLPPARRCSPGWAGTRRRRGRTGSRRTWRAPTPSDGCCAPAPRRPRTIEARRHAGVFPISPGSPAGARGAARAPGCSG
ncbi:RNA polymerase sigma factor [Barrientosiimonas endolithica]|uniref:Uncharacterized protein n=1 Tax=Barrientosiimonas endolithica TaxID=1535208 RepID=A0ABN6YJ17_9MICO|nr:DUF6596 domain-containing protein [Barrientosiimonas endolithica]BDZ57328.1 hypothetical protein GCM10025872_09850 [Barrientosiimonas endolithica]